MSVTAYLRGYWNNFQKARTLRNLRETPPKMSLGRNNWDQSLKDPTGFYLECVRYFEQSLRSELKEHRAYFFNVPSNRRGFGEDAFHVMWNLLLTEYKPTNFLEIGVFRGQVISLVALWAKLNSVKCDVWGISQFAGSGDSECNYRQDINYYDDTIENFAHFSLPRPNLLRASSTDPESLKLLASRTWDMIYIDGNHDYEVVCQDWQACSRAIKMGGIIVLDDSGITDAYHPPAFAFPGCPGPSRLAAEIECSKFREVLQVGHNRAFQKIAQA